MKYAATDKASLADLYEYFKKITADAFQFLIDDYEFQHVRTDSSWECVIEYRNKTTCVEVECDPQAHAGLYFGWLHLTPDGTTCAEPLDLGFLLTIRCPEKKVNQKKYPTREDLNEAVYSYAALLREYAHDILTGDFQVYPQLKTLAEESRAKYFAQFTGRKPSRK